MTKQTKEKEYTYEVVRQGNHAYATLQMNKPNKQGRYCSATCAYPLTKGVKDKNGDTHIMSCTRKETIAYLLGKVSKN